MARNVNFDLSHPLMEAGLESPADEEGVHDSFQQLIAEHTDDGAESSALELQQLQSDLDEESRDNIPLCGPEHEHRRQGASDLECDGGEREMDQIQGEGWSSDTLKILSSMPSRTIGRNRGAIISQYCNKTLKLRRRRQTRPSIRDFSPSSRPTIRSYGMEGDTTDAEVNKRERLVNNLQNLPVSDRVRMLRGMPLSVAEKKEIRNLVMQKEKRILSNKKLSCYSQLKYYIIIAARKSWYSWLSFLHSLQPWQTLLKRVSGRFGTGVLSYFLFLKTLLFFNVFLFLVTGAFLVLPQAVHPPDEATETTSFSGLDLLTGAGSFSHTVMYYGYYTNYTLPRRSRGEGGGQNASALSSDSQQFSYNMPLAYFFTIGMAFFITCIILVYSMSKTFGRSFRINKSHSILTMKTFSSWDFKVIKKKSVQIMSENICTQLKELLAELTQKHTKSTFCKRFCRLMVHGVAWTICIASTTGCMAGVYHFSEFIRKDQQNHSKLEGNPLMKEARLLSLPAVVSLINLLLPALFNLVAWMEIYESPSVFAYVAIGRNLMLKTSMLGVLCFHWLGGVAPGYEKLGLTCWESFVGQELYRFLLMDFIFTLLDTLFGELLWRLFSEKVLKRKRKPVFDIARNVLDLIYGQTLAWLGVLFSPLLPAVQILKLFLVFYIKMSSVMMNCQAPRKPYRASQMTTIFITLLCIPSLLGASVCVTYTMWSITPSTSCGPFRGLSTMFKAGKHWMEILEKDNPRLSVLSKAHTYFVENPFFLFVGAGIFLIVIYFHSQVVDGQRKIISLLQDQIQNEGEDKKFLINQLQSVHKQKQEAGKRLKSQDSTC
ncbi:receptor-type tyrosine-protein phosphatase U [Sarotherodon galilaeus]